MFFLLSKVLDLAVSPLAWSLALLGAALLLRRRPRAVAAAVLAAAAVLWGFSTGTVSHALMSRLEASAVRTARPDVTYDVVIVLSGMNDDGASRETGRLELTAAADRIVAGFELIRAGRARTILLAGGPPSPAPAEQTEPELLAAALRAWGVDPSRIATETVSRNTHENAVEAARIVRQRGWRSLLLVTSAAHMQRALGCFRREGLSPDAWPVDYRATHGGAHAWEPRVEALLRSSDALHELLGRAVYRLVGYTAPAAAA